MGRPQRNTKFWNRERIILGLRRYFDDFGITPTDQGRYAVHSQFTGRTPDGRPSNNGWHQKYPSASSVLNLFPTMRHAWEAAGFNVNHTNLEWLPIEDWFIVESCGVLPRAEVAIALKRSVASVKRRLYDLGRITCKTRWGITVCGAAHKLGIAEHIVHRYVAKGIIPVFVGFKLLYVNPADLLLIKEIDWNEPQIDAETEALIKRCLIQRALKILKFGKNWRDHEIYKLQPVKRSYKPHGGLLTKHPVPEPPNKIKVGDWVKVNRDTMTGVAGRVGIVRGVHYSPLTQNRRDGTKRRCWVARVEFPKRGAGNPEYKRVNYTFPLDNLDTTLEPQTAAKPLSMNTEAVRGRNRKDIAPRQKRIRQRYQNMSAELT